MSTEIENKNRPMLKFGINLSQKIFMDNMIVIKEISNYIPQDLELLSTPIQTNIADPFFQFIFKLPQNPSSNNLLVATNLLAYFRSINRSLSKVHSAHQYLIKNRNHSFPPNTSQSEIDAKVNLDALVIEEYNYELRQFITNIKIATDQLIILLTTDTSKYQKKCESIGNFLQLIENNPNKNSKFDIKFLTALNVAANYLKHHRYQFEEPARIFALLIPSLLVVINKHNDKNIKTFKIIEKYFKDQISYHENGECSFWLDCNFIAEGFNSFYSQLISSYDASSSGLS
jgi:hypothetical protein